MGDEERAFGLSKQAFDGMFYKYDINCLLSFY